MCEYEERNNLEADAVGREEVHLAVVKAVRQQALGRAIPPRADVLRDGLARVDAATAPEVRKLDLVVHEQFTSRWKIPLPCMWSSVFSISDMYFFTFWSGKECRRPLIAS